LIVAIRPELVAEAAIFAPIAKTITVKIGYRDGVKAVVINGTA
jgi:hypothetical protein